MKLIILAIGLTFGNFLWQVITSKDWTEAFKISYFQAGALLIAHFIL